MTTFRAPLLAIAIVLGAVGVTTFMWSCDAFLNRSVTNRMAHDAMATIERLAPPDVQGRRIQGIARQYEWLYERHGQSVSIAFWASLLVLFTSVGTAMIAFRLGSTSHRAHGARLPEAIPP